MAGQENDSLEVLTKLQNLSLEKSYNKDNSNYDCDNDSEKWGLPMTEVYKLAISFYKGIFRLEINNFDTIFVY